MPKEFKEKEKGKLYEMYGYYVRVPHKWYGLCRKYEISKEVATLKTKDNTIELNPMEINVLGYLAGYNLDDDAECHPSNKKLASIFQVGISTIEKYLKELRWVGFIKTFEEKSDPTHTERRDIYVQFNVIDAVLASENNPYKCMVSNHSNPHECMGSAIQTNGLTHIDVGINPYTLATNKKELENIKKNKTETASPQNFSASQEPIKKKYDGRVIPFRDGTPSEYKTDVFDLTKRSRYYTGYDVWYRDLIEPLGHYRFDKKFVSDWMASDYGYIAPEEAELPCIPLEEDNTYMCDESDLPFA